MFAPKLIVLQPTSYCNINCSYCYLRHRDLRQRMSHEVAEAIANNVLAKLPRVSTPTVVWHGGEPTTVPPSWYETAYDVLKPAAPSGTTFSMQSNGVAIDARWIRLFAATNTKVSLSIDGPQSHHDARRKTRAGGPTWHLAMRGLALLQEAGLDPGIISVLSPEAIREAESFYEFYRSHGITHVSFSIDEEEGAHRRSSFRGTDDKQAMADFLSDLLELSYADSYPLRIREIERVAGAILDGVPSQNEQIRAWEILTITADGRVSTFSPELTEFDSTGYGNFVYGHVLSKPAAWEIGMGEDCIALKSTQDDILSGVEACRRSCEYFRVCGGGAPSNKLAELGSFSATETSFCRLSVQAASDALLQFIARRSTTSASSQKREYLWEAVQRA